MRIILVSTGVPSDSVALVDADRLAELSEYEWHATAMRGPVRYTYPVCRRVFLWHQVAGCRAIARGNPMDCRRSNLMPVTFRQICQKRQKRHDSKSQFKGVTGGRWQARIGTRHIGFFDNEEAAARAYDRAAREAFGEFARLNFPD